MDKYQLIVRWSEGETFTKIAEEVGDLKATATKLIQKFKQYGDVLYDARKNNSRPKALDNKDKKVIEKSLVKNPKASLDNLVDIVALKNGKSVSLNRYQHTIGSFNVPVMENLLSARNIQKRLEFCLKYQEDAFSNVIFTDESSFELNRNSQKVFVFEDHEAVRMKRSNRNKMMVWGAISESGKVALHFHDESVDTEVYLEMLEKYLLKIPDRMFGEGSA